MILIASFIDLFFTPRRKQLIFRRSMPKQLERGITYSVGIEVENLSDLTCNVQLIDGTPQSFEVKFPLNGVLPKKKTVNLSYDFSAPVRGVYELNKLYVRYVSNLGLWKKQTAVEVMDEVHVIPDLTESKKY